MQTQFALAQLADPQIAEADKILHANPGPDVGGNLGARDA